MNTEVELTPAQRMLLLFLRFYALVVIGVGILCLMVGGVLGWHLHDLPLHTWLPWLP